MSDFLRPLVAERKKRPYLVLDIETKDGEDSGEGSLYCSTIDRVVRRTQAPGFTRPFLCGLFDGTDYFDFSGPDCLLAALGVILSKKYRGHYIYAHNGGRFDFLHLLPLLRLMGRSFELLTVGSSIQLLVVNDSETKAPWRFVDSYRLIPISLNDATDAFKTTRKLSSHDLSYHEDDPAWREYQRLDCISLYEVLQRYHELVEDKLGGEVGITSAATSMRTFRRSYLRAPIYRHVEHHEFVREAYYGGRVEIHTKEADNLRYYDINSCYPYVMLGNVPTGEAQTWSGAPTPHQRGRMIGFARASVTVPEDDLLPVLPVRDPATQRLIFPVGSFEGIWSAAELMRAEERGASVEWKESVWFESSPALRDFVLDLYAYRDRSRADYDSGLAFVAKNLLNSLYGKFGMKSEKEKLVVLGPDEVPPDGATPNTSDPDCRVWKVPQTVDAPYIIPQIAAHITAMARLHLHRFAEIASKRGVLAYMDTDSIITSADMSDYCSTELGALKDEGEGKTFHGIFLQPKVYLLTASDGSTKVAMKGYRNRSADAFRRLQRGESLTYQSLEKVGTMARRGFTDGPLMRTIVRQARTEDHKRVYLEDGSTRPLVYNSKQGNK